MAKTVGGFGFIRNVINLLKINGKHYDNKHRSNLCQITQ